MAYEVRIQPTALKELEDTLDYLSRFGPNTAASFLDEWESMLEGLRGGIIEHRLSRFNVLKELGYHTVLVKSYIVLYFQEENTIVIAHLFHQSQDYANIVMNG